MKEKVSIDTRVRAIANGDESMMPNWYKTNKESKEAHKKVCETLVQLSSANDNYPITYLVYFAVGKNAHRVHTFLGGYKKIDVKKAEKIFSWLRIISKYHKNDKLFRNPNVAHALCRFYEKFSTKTSDFKAAMELMESNPNVDVKNSKALVGGMGIARVKKENEECESEVVAAEAAI